MDNLLNLGIAIVLWLQSLGLWLAGPMKFFTSLGYEQFYILVAPILIWCIDPALGLRVGLAVMLSSGINGFLKLAFHAPRPYWYDERILPLGSETNFGAPSSHAQNSVVFWGLIAHGLKRGWFWLVAVIMILMISLSRIYLGVHFPSDVVIGWLVCAADRWQCRSWRC
jgi:membrane-associated phospholipid phosphatase